MSASGSDVSTDATPSRRHRRRIVSAAVVMLVVVVTLLAVRYLRPPSRFERAVADARAAGEPVTVADLADTLPAVDQDRQERWSRWLQSAPSTPITVDARALDAWMRAPEHAFPFIEEPTTSQACEEARPLLREGVLTSTGGWLAADRTRTDGGLGPFAVRTPMLGPVQALAQHLAWAALQGDDLARVDLDRLVSSCSHPLTLIDVCLWMRAAATRDDAYLRLCWMGRIAPEAASAWLSETSDAGALVVDGLRGERALNLTQVRFMLEQSAAPRASWRTPSTWLSFARTWWWTVQFLDDAANDSIDRIDRQREVENVLRGRAREAGLPKARRNRDADAGKVPTMAEIAYDADAMHRIVRIAAAVLLQRPSTAPVQPPAAMSAALAGGHDRFALRYARMGERAFSVAIDDAAQAPDGFVDGLDPLPAPHVPTLPKKPGAIVSRHGVLTIVLPP